MLMLKTHLSPPCSRPKLIITFCFFLCCQNANKHSIGQNKVPKFASVEARDVSC